MICNWKSNDFVKFLVQTECPECYLVVYADKDFNIVELSVATQHQLVGYSRHWKDRLRRAWDSLLGRYYDAEFVTLTPEGALSLAKILQKCVSFLCKSMCNADEQ